MSKDSIIKFRVSSEDKDNAQEIIEKLGYKNLSSFFRDYLNSLLELNNMNYSELEILEDFYKSKFDDPNLSHFEIYNIKSKLSTIKEFKEFLERKL